MPEDEYTTIRIKKSTVDILKKKMIESKNYDSVILSLIKKEGRKK